MIRMELKPQVSEAEIRDVTDATGAAVTIPDEITKNSSTNVNVRDGQTIVLGGLFTRDHHLHPPPGAVPRRSARSSARPSAATKTAPQRTEIIFLITPDHRHRHRPRRRRPSRPEPTRARPCRHPPGPAALEPRAHDRAAQRRGREARPRRQDRRGPADKLQRSLALNSNQPEAFRLRERITGLRERWNNPSLLDEIYGDDVSERLRSINTAEPTPEWQKPYMHRDTVREPVNPTSACSGRRPPHPSRGHEHAGPLSPATAPRRARSMPPSPPALPSPRPLTARASIRTA